MSSTANEMLNVVRSQIGYVEGPNNDTKYGVWYGMNHAPYCAIGLTWSAAVAEALDIMGGKWAYCPFWVKHWKDVGRWHGPTEIPRPGDIVFFDWTGRHGLAQHVGIVESVDHSTPSPVLVTIEFNTMSGIPGNQSDGGGVYRRRRSTLYVVGYGRPDYKPQSRPVPIPSRGAGHRQLMPLVVDGVWGRLTTQHLQAWLKLPTDGKLNPVTRARLQTAIGVRADGAWGPVTRRALQKYLHVHQDGVWGPQTVKALQKHLNRTV